MRTFIWLISLLLLSSTGLASELDAGLAAYDKGDYAQAFQHWRPLAEHGNPVAQNNIGALYESGMGVKKDETKALDWYRKAAAQGNARAMTNVGLMYKHGLSLIHI